MKKLFALCLVSLALLAGCGAPQAATASISSRVRISLLGRDWIPSGMQYLHRRLHRSVMEILM